MKTLSFLGIFLFSLTVTVFAQIPASWKIEGPDDPKDWEFSVSVGSVGQEIVVGVSRPDGGFSNGMYVLIPMEMDIYPGDRIYVSGEIEAKNRIPEVWGAYAGVTISARGKNVFAMLDETEQSAATEFFSLDTLSVEIWNCDIVSMSCSIIEIGIERDGEKIPFDFTTSTGVANESPTPENFELCQNYPNPANPTTTIEYSTSNTSNVTLTVFDILGKEVATLVNEVKPAGNYSVNFNAADLPSGCYFYKLNNGSQVLTQKMMLIK